MNRKLYRRYIHMKERCYDPNDKRYHRYGGRGIKICDEWLGEHGFENFYDWSMSNGYTDDLTIDRIDNDKGYSPDNCRWATQLVQANNTRKNIYIQYQGKTQSLPDWCRELNLEYSMIYLRYKRGWSIDRMFNEPKRKW